jgi:hypothetical protein
LAHSADWDANANASPHPPGVTVKESGKPKSVRDPPRLKDCFKAIQQYHGDQNQTCDSTDDPH